MTLLKNSLILCTLLFFCKISAQTCRLSGYVVLDEDMNKEGILIQLLDTTGTKLFHFKTSDSIGHFAFEKLKIGFYKLHIAQLGYRDTSIVISCYQADIKIDTIRLKRLTLDLAGITIVDKAVLMRKSGDTTIFNLKILETGSEQSVTDIAMKIPGLSVNGNQYLFQNKPIKKVLINGKDISDNQQVEFTDAIHYKAVEDLRIIENYSDTYQPYADNQGKEIAMDIKIKAKYKNRIQATTHLSGGYRKIHDIGATIINTNDKTAFRVVTASSNTGKKLNNVITENYIKEVENSILFNGHHQMLAQVEAKQNTTIDENYFALGDKHLKAAIDSKIGKKYRIKSNLMVRNLGGNQDLFSTRQFFSDFTSTQDILRRNAQRTCIAQADNHLSVSYNASTNLELDIPFSLQTDAGKSSENGSLNSISYENENNQNVEKIVITPIYKFHKTFPNNLTLSIFGMNGYIKDSASLNIGSKDSVGRYFVFDPSDGLYRTDQSNTYSSFHLNNQIRLRKEINNFDLQYNLATEKNVESLSNKSDYFLDKPFSGSEQLDFTSVTNSIRSLYDRRSFRIVFGVIHSYSSVRANWGVSQNNFIRPNLLVMYRLNSKWNVSSSYTTKFTQPSILQTNELQTLSNQLNITEGGSAINDIGIAETYNFSLFREFEIGEEVTLFNSMFSFSPKSKIIYPVYNFDSFFQIKSYKLLNLENQMSLQLFFNKKFRLWNFHVNLLASTSKLYIDENIIHDKSLISDFGINFFKLKSFRISSSVDIRVLSRESISSRSLNLNIRPKVSLAFDKGLFQGRIWYQWLYNQTSNSNNSYHILNFEFNRKKVFKHFELNFKVNDLLNLVPNNINVTSFNPIYVQTDSYKPFPGQILVGLKWYFTPSMD